MKRLRNRGKFATTPDGTLVVVTCKMSTYERGVITQHAERLGISKSELMRKLAREFIAKEGF